MKLSHLSWVALTLSSCLFLGGCGGSESAKPTEEQKAEFNKKMEDDMKSMTLPQTPGGGAAPSGEQK